MMMKAVLLKMHCYWFLDNFTDFESTESMLTKSHSELKKTIWLGDTRTKMKDEK